MLDETERVESYVAAQFDKEAPDPTFDLHIISCGKKFDFLNTHFYRIESKTALGFCVDIGAPRSVIGREQLDYIVRERNHKIIPRSHSGNRFRFDDVIVQSIGIVELFLMVPAPRRPIAILFDVVRVNVPALFRLDVLDAESQYADNVTTRIVHRHLTLATQI